MKHRSVFVASALCAFASVAPLASAQTEPPVFTRNKAAVIVSRLVAGQPLTQVEQAAVIVARDLVPFRRMPKSGEKTSPMLHKPEGRYQYLGLKSIK